MKATGGVYVRYKIHKAVVFITTLMSLSVIHDVCKLF